MGRKNLFDTLVDLIGKQYRAGGDVLLSPSDVTILLDGIERLRETVHDMGNLPTRVDVRALARSVEKLRSEVGRREKAVAGGPMSQTRAFAIAKAVGLEHGVTIAEMESNNRTARVVHARHAAIRQIHAEMPKLPYIEIGRMFGKDHTTVMHALGLTREGRRRGHGLAQVREAA